MLGRRVALVVTCAAYVLASTGVPIPEFVKKGHEDFPCRYHSCGCLNAEMCRTHCACFKHRDTAHDRILTRKAGVALRPHSCCSRQRPRRRIPNATRRSRLERRSAPPDTNSGVAILTPLGCRALTTYWVVLGWSPLPTAVARGFSVPDPGHEFVSMMNALSPQASCTPPLPPPRA